MIVNNKAKTNCNLYNRIKAVDLSINSPKKPITMTVMSLNLGLFFIGLGFLVKAVPDLIAGYNTMSKEQKANVDILGLSTFMRNVLIVIGLIIIAGNFLLRLLEFPMIASLLTFIVPFVGIPFLIVKAQKFDHNKQGSKSKMTYFVFGFVVLFAAGLLYFGTTPAKIEINGEKIILNRKNKTETEQVFENIKTLINK